MKNIKNFFWIFRNLLMYFFSATYLIFNFFLAVLFFWAPYKLKYKILVFWSYLSIWAAKYFCGLKYEVKGLKNIPQKACVVVSNHQTTWDTIIMQVLLPPQTWVFKKELLSIPIFGWLMRILKPIAIDRNKKTNAIKQLVSQGKQRLKDNIFIVIFPEGTRVPFTEEKPFSRGAAVLAKETKVPLLPIAHNAGKFWPRSLLIKKPGKITIIIGKTIETKDKDSKKIINEAEHWINNKRKEINPL